MEQRLEETCRLLPLKDFTPI